MQKVGLIERDLGTKIRLLVTPPVGFGPDSLVLRSRHADFLQKTVENVLSPEKKDSFALLKPMTLPRTVLRQLVDEITEVVDKFAFLSEHPSNRENAECENWNVAFAAGPGGEEEAEAKIVNLE